MCCLAFFVFLRVSEFTIPKADSYDSTCHLSFKDIAIDSRDNPQLLQVVIKQSKTVPFRKRVSIYLDTTDSVICPVRTMLSYLARRGGQTGPLFISQNGYGITWRMFSSELDSLLAKLKLDQKQYSAFELGQLLQQCRPRYQKVTSKC